MSGITRALAEWSAGVAPMMLRNVRLPPDGRRAADILIEGGRIAAVGAGLAE